MSVDREILAEIHLNHSEGSDEKVICMCTRIFLKQVTKKNKIHGFKFNFLLTFSKKIETHFRSLRQHLVTRKRAKEMMCLMSAQSCPHFVTN